MFHLFVFNLSAVLSKLLAPSLKPLPPVEIVAWHEADVFRLPTDDSDLLAQNTIDRYLKSLQQQGISPSRQGVWLQSNWTELASHQGNVPLSAASLTKIATTLAAIDRLGIDRRFTTQVYHTGNIEAGTLRGDLIVVGDSDPFFVWEEAIALANSLNALGIKRIEGNLLVSGKFYMNYQADTFASAQLLFQGLNPRLWSKEVRQQFATLPPDTPKPDLVIIGKAKQSRLPQSAKLLISHSSLSLTDILRAMNIYSNNYMAQMLADLVGGGAEVAALASRITNVPSSEIQLINGSGLGIENRISPRAAVKMLVAIEAKLQPYGLSVADIFPVAGIDTTGTMENRNLPIGVAIKTGTLNNVSALAGMIPLKEDSCQDSPDCHRKIWFATINQGWQIERFRQEQDNLLQQLQQQWNRQNQSYTSAKGSKPFLGDPKRNQLHSESSL